MMRCNLLRAVAARQPYAVRRQAQWCSSKGALSMQAIRESWDVCSKQTKWAIGVLATCGGIEAAGVGMIVPFIPTLAEEMGLGSTGAGLLVSAAAVGRVVANMPLGNYADTRGRKPLLIWGQILTAAGIFFTAVAPNVAALVTARFALGVGASATAGGTSAYTADITAHLPEHRGVLIGIINSISTLAYVLGPSVGGILANAFGLKGPFFVFAGVTFVTTAAYCTLPETLDKDSVKKEASSWREWRYLWTLKEQRGLVAANVAVHIRWSAYLTLLPLHAVAVWGADPIQLGIMYSIAAGIGMAGVPVAAWASDKVGRLAVLHFSTILSCIGIATVCLAQGYWQFIAGLIAWELGEAALTVVLSVLAVDHAPADKRGQSLALQRQSGDLTLLIGPLVMGFMSDLVTSGTAFGIAGCAVTSTLLLLRSLALLK